MGIQRKLINRVVRVALVTVWVFTSTMQVLAQPWTGPVKTEVGPEEKVFEYTIDRCAIMDLPDVYAHAVRTPNGIVLASGNAPDNYFMFGSNFNSLKRKCTPVLSSGNQWAVDSFDHQEWITSLYSDDGVTIHALVHNEYHDPYARNCRQGVIDPSNPCWYNFITYAVSHDSGHTFTQPASPSHLVAMLPFQWNAAAVPRGAPPPHGYFEPSNIVRHQGYYYCMMFGILSNTTQQISGTCIMRTADLSVPGSWMIWDGTGFNIPLLNPYPVAPADSSPYIPAFVSHNAIRDLRGSLTWNTYLQQFILVGAGVHQVKGVETCGFFFSRSSDLINWSPPQLIRQTILGWSPCNQQTPEQVAKHISQEAYPSLIDHDAPDISFTYVDSTAYLYFMQNMDNHSQGGWGLRRDLVRVPVRFIAEGLTGISDQSPAPNEISVYPNPSNSLLTVSLTIIKAGHYRLTIYNSTGQQVEQVDNAFYDSGNSMLRFDLSGFNAGIYTIVLSGMETNTVSRYSLLK